MNHPIKIHFKDGSVIQIQLAHLTTKKTNVSLENPIKEYKAVFVSFYHKKVQTFLDVSGVPDHVLLIFNRDKDYIGFNLCKTQEDNSHIIGTRAK